LLEAFDDAAGVWGAFDAQERTSVAAAQAAPIVSCPCYHASPLRAARPQKTALFVAVAASACGSARTPPGPAPAPAATRAKAPAARPDAGMRWARFEEVRGWPSVNARAFASRGHGGGRYSVEVRVDAQSREAYVGLRPDTPLANGTLIAAFHHDPVRGQSGPIYVMEKLETGWSRCIGRRPDRRKWPAGLCRRCHAEAAFDYVFGSPRAPAPPGAGSTPDAGAGGPGQLKASNV
jgi:hypothetical protein